MIRNRYDLATEFEEAIDSENEDNKKHNIHSISFIFALSSLLCFFILFGVVIFIDGFLPAALTLQDEKKYPDSFIAERAIRDLKHLTDNGPRVVGGYENEIAAVNFLMQELSVIQQHANTIHIIETDIQITSGSYFINYKPFGAYNSYGNVQNVIVKLHSKNNSAHSLMINAHFDSVPSSPGGSDDGINCAVMLEVLRKMSALPYRPEHNIIFLFNGAEETPLQASHGFITQHKWAKEVQVIINLEAAGSGGKDILFQTGPNAPWLLKYYAMVPHPHGQAAGEEIFQANLIPSDTDFRIFRDFGNKIGYDIAFVRNGYRYHTSYDDFKSIPSGSYQHIGDNILSLVKNLANASELENPSNDVGNTTFFDILGLFMISYGENASFIINGTVVILSLLALIMNLRGFKLSLNGQVTKFLSLTTCAILLGWLLACGYVYVTAVIVDYLKYTMSWYKYSIIVIGLYVIPTIMCSCLPIIFLNNYRKKIHISLSVQCQIQSNLIRMFWTALLLIGTCLKIRTSYAIMIPVLFNSLGFILLFLFKIQHSVNKWKITYIIINIFPTAMLYYQLIIILSLFIPITGRWGSNRNPEIVIGFISGILTILWSSFYINFITMVQKPMLLIYGFLGIYITTLIIIVTPLGFPYSGSSESPTPQRFMIYHTQRIFHNETGDVTKTDSGYFLINLDRNSPESVKSYVTDLRKTISINDDCKTMLVCGLPLVTPRMLSIMEESTWIPAEKPIFTEDINLKLNSRVRVASTVVRYNFTVTGPDHTNVYFSTRNQTNLLNISLSDSVPVNQSLWNGQPIYFINHVWGKENTELKFYLDIEVPENWPKPVLDIAVSGKYLHTNTNKNTANFAKFLKYFPDWANVIPALANFESWVL